jgi:hypothetical protein
MPFLVFRKEPVLNGPHLNPVACAVWFVIFLDVPSSLLI